MTAAQLIPVAITASIFGLVFTLGLDATVRDAIFLFRQPRLLVRSILSMNVLMVVFAVAVAALFDLHPAVEIALVALAVSPIPPILPRKQQKLGGKESYAVGLLVAAVLLSIVLVPALIELIGPILHADVHMPARRVVPIVMVTAILPLLAGMAVRHFTPALADRIARPLMLAATALLVLALLPVLYTLSGVVWNLVGNGVLIVMALFTLVGLAIGHALGGPDPDDRTVLALSTGARHPGIALAIATANFPEQKGEILAVILCHLIVGAIVSLPYARWRKRVHAANLAAAKQSAG